MGRAVGAALLSDDEPMMMMQMYFTSALPVTVLFEGWVVSVGAPTRFVQRGCGGLRGRVRLHARRGGPPRRGGPARC